jgi:DNA-binding response OmpR family regulator
MRAKRASVKPSGVAGLPDGSRPARFQPDMAQPARDIFGKRTALVVDDDLAIRHIMERALASAGFRVICAGDGREALRILSQEDDIAVIIADLQMPRLDGRNLAAHLAERESAPPILFVSGYDSPPGPHQLPGPFLAKPFKPDMLINRVRLLLGH